MGVGQCSVVNVLQRLQGFLGTSECLRRYLMTQGIINPATAIVAACTVISIPYNLMAVQWLGLGLDGAALGLPAGRLLLHLLAELVHTQCTCSSQLSSHHHVCALKWTHTQACHDDSRCQFRHLSVCAQCIGSGGSAPHFLFVAAAVNCTQLTNMLGLLMYIAYREKQLKGTDRQTWHGW